MDEEKCLIDEMLRPAGFEALVQRGCLVYYERTGKVTGIG